VDLSHGADVLLQNAQSTKRGSYYTLMGSLLLRAFTFEAYVNHLGAEKSTLWPEVETLRVMDKYSLLCKSLGLTPNFSRRPYQTLGALFRFRNSVAHGKSIVLNVEKDVSSKDDPHDHIPKTEWEEYVSEPNAVRAAEDISQIITEMHVVAGLGDYPFVHGVAVSSVSLKEPSNQALQPTSATAAAERQR
jgi:hypothetical protein